MLEQHILFGVTWFQNCPNVTDTVKQGSHTLQVDLPIYVMSEVKKEKVEFKLKNTKEMVKRLERVRKEKK